MVFAVSSLVERDFGKRVWEFPSVIPYVFAYVKVEICVLILLESIE